MRRLVPALATIALLVAVLVGATGADARPSDTKGDRDRVRGERARVAANLNVLKANQQQVESALDALQANVDAEEGRLAEAERAVADAEAQIDRAERGIAANTAHLARLKKAMVSLAVEAYVAPEGTALSSLLDSHNASDAALRQAFRGVTTARDADVADQIRGVKAGLEVQRRAAAAAKRKAAARRSEVAKRVNRVRAARSQQETVLNGVQQRIAGQVDRSIELAKQDRALSVKLALQQAALEARLAAARAARQRRTVTGPAYGNGGSETGPVAGPGGVTPSGGGGSVSLCTVGGITVACKISGSLQSMLSAAAASGVSLSGGGYRDPSAQIALRRAHCGSSSYAIYEMSPSACRPPTARPGQSMHELGLAIDFNSCSSRGSACYGWLSGHASSYGFYNLPSEPWHWSVNGN